MEIALLGSGVIGKTIAKAVRDEIVDVQMAMVMDHKMDSAEAVAGLVDAEATTTIEDILNSKVDLVVEAASQEAVRLHGIDIISSGKSIMIMSVGALADEELLEKMLDAAKENSVKIYVPSGAIGGLDAIASASIGGLDEVTLSTTKPPKGLGLEASEKSVVYEGTAGEAVKLYPANINISASLSLAGLGFNKTKVKISIDPEIEENVHEIDAKGEFGEIHIKVENTPSSDNPKTSYLAAMSAIAMLKRISSPLEIGN